MPKQNMTERWLEQIAAKAPEQRQEWTDTGQRMPGIALLLRNGPGRMTWALRYRSPADGSRRRLKIGFYPMMTLDGARAVHREKAEQLRREIDPVITLREEENLPILSEVMIDFIEHCRAPRSSGEERTRIKGWKVYAKLLGVRYTSGDLVPDGGLYTPREWLHLSIAAIEPKMIRQAAAHILDERGDSVANSWQRIFSSMLSHAVSKGWIDRNPAHGLSLIGKEKANQKILGWGQICELWHAASQTDEAGARIARWMLLTGQRAETVLPATWDQMEEDWWRIPVDQLKTERGDHLVYIGTPFVRDLLRQWRESSQGSPYVFASERTGRPYRSSAALYRWTRSLRRSSGVDEFKFKLCRPSVATIMTEVGVELQHVALALDHAIPGVPAITRKHYVNSAKFQNEIRDAFGAYHEALAERLGV